ncbi:MMPL family transporter [Nocardioides donggukensis]|uniref:MMPL family transporter n=1 Tax=Nocardioides donggukensis TaxID=2774019 RepID=A0A927Q383_9ACTN|nr:MMPL family transporter [Nocardioides donggukensis]MBD8870346.1 MMPL family transporter [Nocardioides donggukensis]
MQLSATQRMAMACARRPWRTAGAWAVVVLAALAAVTLLLGSALTPEGRITSEPDSIKGLNLLDERFPERDAASDFVVVVADSGNVADPQTREVVASLRDEIAAAEAVRTVGDPYAADAVGLVSPQGDAVLIPLVIDSSDEAEAAATDPLAGIAVVIDAVEATDERPEVSAYITGNWTVNNDFIEVSQRDLERGELQFGLPAALIVLLLVFGAVVAASVPLLTALVSIVVALGLASLIGQAFELSFFIVNMVVAMGLALGIDYSLFVVSRYREERYAGLTKHEAIAVSGATASKAVLFSGSAFVVALLGMLLVPDTVLRSLATGAVLVGVVTVASALTLLPALVSLLGDHIERLRIPLLPRQHGGESRFWTRAVRIVTRRPAWTAGATIAALVALTLPVLGLQTGSAGLTSLPGDMAARQGFAALETYFPAGARSNPAVVVVDADASSPAVRSAAQSLGDEVDGDSSFGASTVSTAPSGDLTLVEIALTGDGSGSEASAAIVRLREDYVPTAFDGVDAAVYVTGATAFDLDYTTLIDRWLPIVIAFVLTLSFLLLLIIFRSVVLPLKAVALNLLSVGAAYGLMVLVFQEGIGADLLGLQQIDRVEPWVPVFLFSVLFALSMDYHMFLLTRIRERYLATGDTVDAVAHGVGATGRIITGAALIIVVVFLGFATGDLVGFQQMGFGVGVALLIDATVIRTVLVPSSMVLLGSWNWYLPGWLEWLPELHIEGGAEGEAEHDLVGSQVADRS